MNLTVEILVNMIKFNWFNTAFMEKNVGFEIFSLILQKKRKMINPQLFQIILTLVGKDLDNRRCFPSANYIAFKLKVTEFSFSLAFFL